MEDFGDKTEAPTPRRRQEAREQGNIPRSQDLTAAALMVGIFMLLSAYGPGLVMAMKTLVAEMLGGGLMSNQGGDEMVHASVAAVILVARAMAPLLGGILLIAVVLNVAQVGLFFNPKKLQPNMAAINPIKGIKKLLGGGRGWVQFAMSVAKLATVCLVAYSAIDDRLAQIVTVQQLSFIQIFGLGAQIIYSIAMRIAVLLLGLAILDYIYQRFRVEKDLKMSRQEVKDEMRRMDGDPQIKKRRREMHLQMAAHRLKMDVPQADVIVTNPTEFAIALKYDAAAMHSPKVIAKGQGPLAARILDIAIANGVPILERKPLARALFKLVEAGQEIPEEFYSAIAEILAYVYELRGKTRQKRAV